MIRPLPNDYINGKLVRVDSRCYKVPRKTSRYRILNCIYGIIFGYADKYFIEDGECIVFNGTMIMNPNTYKSLKENVENYDINRMVR